MIRHKVDSKRTRRILIAMVVSKPFLAQASKVFDLELVDEPHFQIIMGWCLTHFEEYNDAPGKHIEDLFHKWSEDNDNTELVDAVRDFLEALSEEYDREEEINVPFLLDDLRDFLAKRKIQRVVDHISYSMNQGNVKEAEQAVLEYRKTEVGQGSGLNPVKEDAWIRPFADPIEPIISFEGDAGKFFNQALTRDALVGIQASEKTGKTWWCIEFCMRALMQRKKVALFEVGDLSESQLLLRLGVRWTKRPLWEQQCGKIMVPKLIKIDEEEEFGYKIYHDPKHIGHQVSQGSVCKAIEKFHRTHGLSTKKEYFRVAIYPTSSVNVRDISNVLDQWQLDLDFIPDVIIIDYADILAPEDPKKQARDQVNDTWKALRRLSQERHALVITPTQANAASYSQEPVLQTMKNFSEDKRKLAHVTSMMALNQTPEEKEGGGMRVNWIVLREAPYSSHRPLYVGTCFALGRALCCATL